MRMQNEHDLNLDDLSAHSIERLQKELTAVQNSLEMLFTMNNSLEDLDITHGGGTPEAQAEYQKLDNVQHAIVAEINKRHMLEEIH